MLFSAVVVVIVCSFGLLIFLGIFFWDCVLERVV